MGWKPARGSGIMFEKAFNREMKYRNLLTDYMYKPVGFMEHSKTYYHWLVAALDLEKIQFPTSDRKRIEEFYGMCISTNALRSLEQHRELCYKPLQRLMIKMSNYGKP